MLTILCIVLAAFFKAVADTLADHFYVSIFRNMDERFWNKAVSWKYAKQIPGTAYPVDAWHLSNSGMIISFAAAIFTPAPFVWHWAIGLTAYGVLFIVVFNLFYNKILRVK